MPVRLLLLLLPCLITFFSCGNTEFDIEEINNDIPTDTIQAIAGYDVRHWNFTTENSYYAPQKMTKHHVLGLAAYYCDSTLIAQTLADGANYELQTESRLPILEAALCPDNAVMLVQMLMDAGADVNSIDEYNENVLSYTIAADSIEIVAFLLDNGAAILERDNVEEYGCPPIFSAKSPRMLRYLLDRGLTLTEGCASGRTLLHSAAAEDNGPMIEYLLSTELGNPQAEDQNGQTPWDYATDNASGEAQDLLRPYRLGED